jgi:hypothetical protein
MASEASIITRMDIQGPQWASERAYTAEYASTEYFRGRACLGRAAAVAGEMVGGEGLEPPTSSV